MKVTIKILAVLILAVLASPVFILNGCGKPVNGGQCGSCPDSTAPFGSTIEVPEITREPMIAGDCYPSLSFVVIGPDTNPMSDICVELYATGGSTIAKHTASNCSEVAAGPKTSMVLRTDSSGAVNIAMSTPSTIAGTTFSVEVASCSVTAVATTPAAK